MVSKLMAERSKRLSRVSKQLARDFPEAECELTHNSAFQLLIATILSAQSTDVGVNKVTPKLFKKYPTPEKLAAAKQGEVEKLIGSLGLFRGKAERIIKCAQSIVADFDGEVPTEREDLVSLAGVGRKTANVVRSVAFDLPGLPVDTHVKRITGLLDLTDHKDPVKIEEQLCDLFSPEDWGDFSLRVILHGRSTCKARKPLCGECSIEDLCPSSLLVEAEKFDPKDNIDPET